MVSSMMTNKYQKHRIGNQAIAAGDLENTTYARASQDNLLDAANDEMKGRVAASAYPPQYEDVVADRTAVFPEPEAAGLEVDGQQHGRSTWVVSAPGHGNPAWRSSLSSSASDAESLNRLDDVVDGLPTMRVSIDGASVDRKAMRRLAKGKYKAEKRAMKATYKEEKATSRAVRKLEKRVRGGRCC
ncbi:hypothetical protein Tdes44962_MAKER01989 [Teratosphaeria destructans]|uniref:Uncharacterized protein n=1 Tax=Teratosphaeria destructans TaxID=418781 RepID=A0A9W7SVX8_9PEZI|nr:hypothetical protein Tdes44962_MAKER01989 [Teratosphaeria destructans]